MPKYRVTDDQTGLTLELEGESPPTEAELESLFSEYAPKPAQEPSAILGAPEAALSIASSTVAEPIAGIAGLVGAALPGEPGQGARFVEATRDALTFEPKSQAGQKALSNVGEALAPIGEAVESGRQAVGDAAFEATGGDSEGAALAGAAGQASVDALLAAIPFLGQAIRNTKNSVVQASRQKIGEKIRDGVGDAETAKFDIDAADNVVKSAEAKSAISQGYDEAVVASLHSANPSDLRNMLSMVDKAEQGSKNARFAAENRPSDVVGSSLGKRIQHVKRVNKAAGREVDAAARSLRGQPVDVSAAVDKFSSALRDKGVGIDPQSGKLSFKGSDFEGLSGPEGALNRLLERMLNTEAPDAHAAHRLKKYIDENVTFGKSGEGLGGQAERMLKDFRHDLNESLKAQFPQYARANQRYSDTIQVLDDFQQVAGQRMDLFGPNADKAIGTLSRRLMSNAQSRVNLIDSMAEVESVAKRYGARFDDDIILQTMFADELGRVFGAAAKTSLQGDIEKAASSAIRGGAREAVTDAVLEGGKRLLGKTDEKAYKAMKQLLRRQLQRRQRQQPEKTAGQQLQPR